MDKTRLDEKRILITRARGQSAEFVTNLRDLGAEVIEFPTIEILPPANWDGVDQAINQLRSYDWIIFTSANGVKYFFERLIKIGHDGHLPSSLRICAIGPATADQLKERGIRVHFTPKEFIAEAILRGFKKTSAKGRRILLARAEKARDILPEGLREMGAEVDVITVYQTVKPKGGSRRLTKLLMDGRIDVITFTSSSTVNHFAELLEKEDLNKLLEGIAIACIGPITARTAKGYGMKVRIQPKEYTIPALTQAIVHYFSTSTSAKNIKWKRPNAESNP